ncbi:MAG: alkene reductase [Candidatus Sericytochromatia bacterium]|nr:alkene reductase [Candidatus Sericytochromatia bacterium]
MSTVATDVSLFAPYDLGPIPLANRIVMAPMTRNRATGNVPNDLMVEYYAQRASAGLIITEGTSPSPNGLGYARIPGAFNQDHAAGWQRVTEAVHAKGGRIFIQLMHTGRASHPANMAAGTQVLSASAVPDPGPGIYTDAEGMQPFPVPTAMTVTDIQTAVQEFADSAKLAVDAGFDGVELHGANGYLLEEFLNPAANQRTDAYGGSDENRQRFVLEVAAAVVAAIGGDRLGIRLSPYGVFGGMAPFAGIEAFYGTLAGKLNDLGLAYLHMVDHSAMGAPAVPQSVKDGIRAAFKKTVILSGGYDAARAQADLTAGKGDLVAFGRPFISNPDLVVKLKSGAALRAGNMDTFYTPGEVGYTDYPVD